MNATLSTMNQMHSTFSYRSSPAHFAFILSGIADKRCLALVYQFVGTSSANACVVSTISSADFLPNPNSISSARTLLTTGFAATASSIISPCFAANSCAACGISAIFAGSTESKAFLAIPALLLTHESAFISPSPLTAS